MQIDLDTLPDDPATLQQMLRDVVTAASHQQGELHAENDKLRLLIQRPLRHRFGRRSEQLSPDRELRTEQLDIVPSQLRVRVTRRPRYACRACEDVVVAPAPERPIDGGMATEALVAHVEVGKFCDALPLCRQVRMLARQGITLDRSTLAKWVGRACWWLTPLYDLIVSTVLSSDKMFADDTTLPVLDPGRGRTRTGRLWCYAVDDRPWCGPRHLAAAYIYSEDRKGAPPAGHLAGFRGVLQVDGYAGFKRLSGDRTGGSVQLAFCWAHMRRPFYGFHVSTQSPLAAEVLVCIRALYAIEAEIRDQNAGHRRQVRQDRSRVEMDTNVVERAIRPVPLTRKNALFAGSDGGARHWAIAMTLIQTAKLNGIDPMARLTGVLERIVSGRTKSHELHSLLP